MIRISDLWNPPFFHLPIAVELDRLFAEHLGHAPTMAERAELRHLYDLNTERERWVHHGTLLMEAARSLGVLRLYRARMCMPFLTMYLLGKN
jgi:hypothetical protein